MSPHSRAFPLTEDKRTLLEYMSLPSLRFALGVLSLSPSTSGARPTYGWGPRAQSEGRSALPVRVPRVARSAQPLPGGHGRRMEREPVPLPEPRQRFRARSRGLSGYIYNNLSLSIYRERGLYTGIYLVDSGSVVCHRACPWLKDSLRLKWFAGWSWLLFFQ